MIPTVLFKTFPPEKNFFFLAELKIFEKQIYITIPMMPSRSRKLTLSIKHNASHALVFPPSIAIHFNYDRRNGASTLSNSLP